jgi:hypothetical protein
MLTTNELDLLREHRLLLSQLAKASYYVQTLKRMRVLLPSAGCAKRILGLDFVKEKCEWLPEF